MTVSGEVIAKTSLFQWEIDISCFDGKTVGDSLKSPIFTSNNSGITSKWQLNLYPKGESKKCEGYSSLFLYRVTHENDVNVKYSFSILNQENKKVNIKLFEYLFKHGIGDARGERKFVNESFLKNSKYKLLKDNKLRILCKLITKKYTTNDQTETQDEKKVCRLKEFDSFEELFISKAFSDVTVKADGENFELHKCILSTRSPVFEAMFRSDMEEKNKNVVEITDVKYQVLQELFLFIYTGKVNDIAKIVGELLIAADKYCIQGLKELCEKTICDNIKPNNVIKYLELAITNNAEKVRAETINWISLYLDVLVDSKQFADLDKQNPGVLLEIMKKYFDNQI